MKLEEEKLSGSIVYDGHLLEVHNDEVLCPNGHKSHREYINKCPAACVVAKTSDNLFILEKQFRYPYHDIIIEFPAGKADLNEDPRLTAQRELEEETGYYSDNIIYLGATYPSVAYTNEVIHLFFAKDLIKKETHLDENEFVEVIYKSEEEVIQMIKNGKIRDAKTVHAFTLYLLNKDNF